MDKLTKFNTAVSCLTLFLLVSTLLVAAIGVIAFIGYKASMIAVQRFHTYEPAINQTVYALRAAHFAYGMDRLYDSLPEQPIQMGEAVETTEYLSTWWGMKTNDPMFGPLITTVLPYFSYEGIACQSRVPRMVVWVPFAQGSEHFHIGGRASCTQAMFLINYEYLNTLSPRFQRDSFLQIFVHEMGHVQGVCCDDPRSGCSPGAMETDNQVATLEILAAMCNRGHSYACKPLIGELRNEAMDYVRGSCYGNGTMPLYDWFAQNIIYNKADERSRVAKSLRYWSGTEARANELRYIITAYGMRPFWKMSQTLASDDLTTDQSPYYPNKSGTIKLDDLHYLLNHIPQMLKIANQPMPETK